jgi:stage III sporulation protein SpoIIIAA
MSLITEITDAVVQELNSAPPNTFTKAFTAERKLLPVYELKDLVELRVTAVPKAVEITGSTRSASQHDFAIDIGVQKKLPAGTAMDTEVQTLSGVVDQIAEYLRQRPLQGAAFAAWVSTTNDPVYAPEHLHEQRTFTSVLTLIYRAMK